jgi:hypothetical protein
MILFQKFWSKSDDSRDHIAILTSRIHQHGNQPQISAEQMLLNVLHCQKLGLLYTVKNGTNLDVFFTSVLCALCTYKKISKGIYRE